MLFGPHDIRQLCVHIVEANKANDEVKVSRLLRELQSAIRSHIQQTRTMAAHAVRRSFLKSSESYKQRHDRSSWPYADGERHDELPLADDLAR